MAIGELAAVLHMRKAAARAGTTRSRMVAGNIEIGPHERMLAEAGVRATGELETTIALFRSCATVRIGLYGLGPQAPSRLRETIGTKNTAVACRSCVPGRGHGLLIRRIAGLGHAGDRALCLLTGLGHAADRALC